MTMEDILSQLLLSVEQPHQAFDALLDQASLNLDPGYYSASQNSSPRFYSAVQNPDPGYYSASPNPDPEYYSASPNPHPGYYSASPNPDPEYYSASPNPHPGYYSASPNPDPGYYSACGSISPASSSDSGCFSPQSGSWAAVDSVPKTIQAPGYQRLTHGGRKSRCRNPGKKRQSASEREKLRMRDLAKALHHLRTFLPPSVAPAGQTLTKIETLRLAIRYISHLSEQLLQEPSQGGVTYCSPRLPPAQASSPLSTAESLPSYRPSLPQQPEHLSPPLPSLNPFGDFSFAAASSECSWIPELSHTPSGN